MSNIATYTNKLFLILIPTVSFLIAIFFPFYNLDSMLYIASAYDLMGNNIDEIRELLNHEVNNYFPKDLVEPYMTSPYSGVFLSDTSSLKEQLNFYNFRIGYLYIGILLHIIFQLPMISCFILIQAVSSFIVAFLALYLTLKLNNISAIFTAIFLIAIDFVSIVRLTTPDMLCSALILIAFYFYLEDKKKIAGLFICLLPAFRTDLIIFCFIYILFNFKEVINWIYFLFACLLYFFLNYYFETYGYQKTLEFTFFASSPERAFPSLLSLDLGFKDYLIHYLTSSYLFIKWFGFIMMGAFAALFSSKSSNTWLKPALISIGFIAVHFLLFPSGYVRYYLWGFIILYAWFIATFFLDDNSHSHQQKQSML